MATTFIKYIFYAANQTPPTWLTSGQHNVPLAMNGTATFLAPITTAMGTAIPNTATVLSSMNTWANYLDVNFNSTSGTKTIAFGGWKPSSSFQNFGSVTTFTRDTATDYAILFNNNTTSTQGNFQQFNTSAAIGNWGGWSFMHELGHVLGLNHFTEVSPTLNETPDLRFSIMYYPTRINGAIDPSVKIPLTPGMSDIDWLQDHQLNGATSPIFGASAPTYGVSTTSNGADSYTFTQQTLLGVPISGTVKLGTLGSIIAIDPAKAVMTIWDSGGNDTIDASLVPTKVYINLNAGEFSSIGSNINTPPPATSANLGGNATPDGDTKWNVGIALGAQIENARGGGGADIIVGNTISNLLIGNNGDDNINGDYSGSYIALGGDDFLYGNSGNDALNGQVGIDRIDGGTGSNFLTGGTGRDTFFADVSRANNSVNTWTTITDFDRQVNLGMVGSYDQTIDEKATLLGWQTNSQLITSDNTGGTAGYTGATYYYDLDGNNIIDTAITFTGLSLTQVGTPMTNSGAGTIVFG